MVKESSSRAGKLSLLCLVLFLMAPGHGLVFASEATSASQAHFAAEPDLIEVLFRILSADILDAAGRVLRSVPIPGSEAGAAQHTAWDGTDASGRPAAAGVYCLRARTADGRTSRQKLVLVR